MSSSRAGCAKGMSQSQLAHGQLPNTALRPLGEAPQLTAVQYYVSINSF